MVPLGARAGREESGDTEDPDPREETEQLGEQETDDIGELD